MRSPFSAFLARWSGTLYARLELDRDFCFHLYWFSIDDRRFVLALPRIFQRCSLQWLRARKNCCILNPAIGSDQNLHAHRSLDARGLSSRRIIEFRLRN